MPEHTTQNPLGIKSIKETIKVSRGEQLGHIIKQIFTFDWIFNKWYEKIIISGSIIYTGISIWRMFNGN